jgi:ribonucleoside-diphosphate reductase beta chain
MSSVLYSKKSCEQCVLVKDMLRSINHEYEEVVVDNLHDMCKYESEEDVLLVHAFPVLKDNGVFMSYHEIMNKYAEPLLLPSSDRYVIFPIKYPDMWDMYERSLASFWTVNEIDFSRDESDFKTMNDNERHFIKHILAFFAGADGIVNENIALNFYNEVQIPEARSFYSYQQFNETIHSHTYSLLIDRYVTDESEKLKILNGIVHIPSVGKKASWAKKWIQHKTFSKRLIAFACVEGIMFSGSFCAIFWLKKRGLMPGLTFSNELISRDEGMHQKFAELLFTYVKNKPTQDDVFDIVREAVEYEKEFIIDAIPCKLIGMNSDLMSTYIEFVADRLLVQLGYEKLWNSTNPFDFMENMSLSGKTNFFERRVSEYSKASMMVDMEKNQFNLKEEF